MVTSPHERKILEWDIKPPKQTCYQQNLVAFAENNNNKSFSQQTNHFSVQMK